MANIYWVGGSGTWDTTTKTNWASASGGIGGIGVPNLLSNVFFDQPGTYTVTCTGGLVCRDINVTAGIVTFAEGSGPAFTIGGSFNIKTGTIWSTLAGITFNSTLLGNTITTNDIHFNNNIVFNGIGGGWTLGSHTGISAAQTFRGLTITAGTLNTNGYNWSGDYGVFAGGLNLNGPLAVLNLSSSTMAFSGMSMSNGVFNGGNGRIQILSNQSTAVNISGGTFNCETSTIELKYTGAGTGAQNGITTSIPVTFYNVLSSNVDPSNISLAGNNTFNNISANSRTGVGTTGFSISGDIVVGSLNIGGAGPTKRYVFYSATTGVQRTITINNSSSLTDVDFIDIAVIGPAAPLTGTRLNDLKGNSGITFPSKTIYWNLAGAQNWSSGWALNSGGTPNVTNLPLAQDTCIFDDVGSVTGTITMDLGYVGTVDMSARTIAMSLSAGGAFTSYGNWINGSGTQTLGVGPLIFSGRNTQNITSLGLTFSWGITVNSIGGTVNLLGALTTNSTSVGLTNGTFNLNNYTLTSSTFNSNSSNIRYLKNCATITLLNSGVTIWDTTTTTGLTIDGTPVINCTYSGAVGTRTLSSGILPNLTALSFNITAGTDIIVIPATVNNINFTGFAGTWNNAAITLYGNLTLASGMTLTAGTNTMTFANQSGVYSGTKTITTAAKTLDFPVTFNALGSIYNLQDAMTIGATRTLTLTAGNVNTQGFNLTTGLLNTTGTTYRTLNMNTGILTLGGVGTVWDATTSTALFYIIPSIVLSDTSVTARTFNGGSIGYQKLTIGGTTGTSTLTINGSNSFEELNSTKTVAHTILFADSSTQTLGKWSATGTVGNVITINRVTAGTFNLLILGPSVSNVDYLSISNCTVSPLSIGKFYAGANSANTINNTNVLFSATPAAVTRYWVAGNGIWDTATTTNWSDTSGGAGGSTVPLLLDDVIFDTSSNATSYVVTVGTTATCANLTMDGPTSGTVTLSGIANSNIYINGNFSLIGGPTKITNSYLGTLNLSGTNRWTCNTNGVILNSFNFIGLGNYITLLNNITSNATTTLTAGTINLNSYNVTTFAFNSNNNNVRNIQFANGVVNLTGANTIIWNSTNAFNFNTTGTPTVNCAPIITSGTKFILGSWAPVNFITSSGSDAVSITSGNNFDFTGYAGTVYAGASTIYGNVIFSSSGSIGPSSGAMTFVGYQPTQNLNTQGLISDFPITINALGSSSTTLQLLSNVTTNFTKTFTHTAGNLNLNGYNLTTGSYSTNNSNIRNINFGANTITLLNYNATVWDSTTATNMGTTGTPTVNVAYSGFYGTRTINGSNAPVNFNITGGSDILTINSGNNFDFTGFSGILTNSTRFIYGNTKFSSTMSLMPGTLITTFIPVSANLTLQTSGKTLEFPITIGNGTNLQLSLLDNCNVSPIATTTLTSGVFDLNGFTLNTGMFSSTNSNVRRLANSNNALILTGYNNTVWNTTTMTNMVVSNTSNIIVNSSSSNGFTIIVGSTLTNTIFKVLGTNYVSPSSGYTFDFTNFTGTLPNLARTIYGSWILSPTMKLQAGINALTFAAGSGASITSAGQTMDFPITFAGVGVTWFLNDNLTLGSGLSKTLTLTNGTLNANNFNVSAGAVWSNNSNIRGLVMGSGTWSLTGKWLIWDFTNTTNLTHYVNTSSISITDTSTALRYFNSGYFSSGYFTPTYYGGILYNTVNIGGATGNSKFVITGSAYYKGLSTSKTQGLTMLFNNGSSVVENFLFTGSAGNYITLANLDPYGTFSLIKSTTGLVSSNFLNIANSVVYPVNTWYAGSNSVDYGNNIDWVNLSTPPQSPMQFLTMF